jgi:tetratricopeptide (TPR) repeat protein
MFFKEYDEIASNLSKYFRSRKSVYETAALFDRLAQTQDRDNPFEAALAGLAQLGALQCFQKVQDTAKTVQTAITAARLFLKTADFNYQISRCLRETWCDALSDGLHCYRVAADLLKVHKKPYLASQVLMELGNAESRFEISHNAANTYEEATLVIIDGKAPLPLLFSAVTAAIVAYNKTDRFDLALSILLRAQEHFFDNNSAWISPLPLMKRQFHDLNIYHAQLLLMTFEHDECITYADQNCDKDVALVFKDMITATKAHLLYQMDQVIERARAIKAFSPPHIALFDRHLSLMSKAIEHGFTNVMH